MIILKEIMNKIGIVIKKFRFGGVNFITLNKRWRCVNQAFCISSE